MFQQNVTLGPGTETFTQHTLEILIMLSGAFLIGLWMGWALWARYKQQIDKFTVEVQSLNATADALRTELQTAKLQLTSMETDRNTFAGQVEMLKRENSNQTEQLQMVESQLAEVQARNRQLETELGLSMPSDPVTPENVPLEIIEPEPTTPEPETTVVETPAGNAETPADNHVAAMEENTPPAFVIEPVAIADPQPEKEKKKSSAKKSDQTTEAAVVAAAPADRDDLSVVEGIGPKIQLLLNQYGIYTYRQLAETEVERLKEILATAGPQLAMHDPGTWPSQANLAANDQWDTLKSVQGFLKGGKKPT